MASKDQEQRLETLKGKIADIIGNLNPDFLPNEDVIEQIKELRLELKYLEEQINGTNTI